MPGFIMNIQLKNDRFVELDGPRVTYWPGIGEPGQALTLETLPEDVLEELLERGVIRRA